MAITGIGEKMHVKVFSECPTRSSSWLHVNLSLTPKAWHQFPVGLRLSI